LIEKIIPIIGYPEQKKPYKRFRLMLRMYFGIYR